MTLVIVEHFPILIQSPEASSEKTPRWKLDKADWQIFKEKCKNRLTHIETNHDIVEHFTETLIEIAEGCVPKGSTTNKRSRPWFDNECRKAIRLRRTALKRFQKQHTTPNLIEYKLNRAKARSVIKAAKKECWQKYVGRLNSSSKPKANCEMIRKIAGKHQATLIKQLSKNNFIITDKKNISDLLAETFSRNSSSQNCKPKFITVKQNAEKYKLNFNSKNQEQYNSLFSLKELKDSIKRFIIPL